MNFDEVLKELGEFGKYQAIIFFLVCMPVIFCAAGTLAYIFSAGTPKYRCFVDGCDDESNPQFTADWLPNIIPAESNAGPYVPRSCDAYSFNSSVPTSNSSICYTDLTGSSIGRCDRWVYEYPEWTIVTQWDLTCPDKLWMLSLVGTINFSGVFVGVFVSGLISDKFGRKKALLITFVVAFLAGIGQTFSPNYETFVVLLFFTVIGNSAMYPVIYVLGVELVGPSKREMAATIIAWFFTFGEVYVAVLAWGLQNWIHMQLLVSCPVIIFLSYYWFVPESIRWLLSKGEHEQACEIIKRAAKINGVTLSPDLLKEDPKSKATSQDEHRRSGILQIFKSQRLLLRALNLFIIWIVNSFVYYGLSTNSTSLGGNKYMNFILVSLVEIPGYSFAWFAMNKFGRRISLSASMFICGASCIGAAFIPEGTTWATVLLFLVGKFGITSSFSIIYVFTTELYPTEMRNSGVGTSSMVARIGSILAPFLNILATYMKSLPLLIFAATSILAATLSLLLPETLGKKLPDSIQEAEDFGRKPSKEQSTELKDIPPNRSDQPNGLPA